MKFCRCRFVYDVFLRMYMQRTEIYKDLTTIYSLHKKFPCQTSLTRIHHIRFPKINEEQVLWPKGQLKCEAHTFFLRINPRLAFQPPGRAGGRGQNSPAHQARGAFIHKNLLFFFPLSQQSQFSFPLRNSHTIVVVVVL